MKRFTPALLPEEIKQLRDIHEKMKQRRPSGDKAQIAYAFAVEDVVFGLISVAAGEPLRANDIVEPAKKLHTIGLKN